MSKFLTTTIDGFRAADLKRQTTLSPTNLESLRERLAVGLAPAVFFADGIDTFALYDIYPAHANGPDRMKGIKVANIYASAKYFSASAIAGVMFVILACSVARAAELVMFERAGCEWCEAFDKQIAPVYAKSEEGLRAPLRRVDATQALPPDLAFIGVERLTPLFVLVDKGREVGRIRGYPGPESFWTQLAMLFEKLNGLGDEEKHTQMI